MSNDSSFTYGPPAGLSCSKRSLISAAFMKQSPLVTMKVMRRQRALAMGGNEGFEADVI
jgi:hypothetical protein